MFPRETFDAQDLQRLTNVASVTNIRIVTILSLLILAPKAVFGDVHLRDVAFVSAANTRELQEERDPGDAGGCAALGELDIAFHTNNSGPPTIGIVLTDPRGRRIGFDPLTKHGWQELPEAEASIDCDASDGKQTCGGVVRVCGPMSGTYKLEIIAQETSHYTVSVFAQSEETGSGQNLRSSNSRRNVSNITIRKGSRNVISLDYSRDPALKVAAQLQKSHRHETGFHSATCQSSKRRSQDCPDKLTAED
jgi:hypothetical protein